MTRLLGPTWEVPVVAVAHAAAFAAVALVGDCTGSPEPLFRPEEVLVVEMTGSLPKTSRMVQKAERAPDPTPGVKAPSPVAPPPPDQMALRDPAQKPAPGDPKADRAREELIHELRKQAALRDLTAPLGDEDRPAASPDGVEGAEVSFGSGRPTDPELAKWWTSARPVVQGAWSPLRSTCAARPDAAVVVAAKVAGDGRITGDPRVLDTSGDPSLDESARRAFLKATRLPALPEKYAAGLDATFRFACKDVL